MDHPPSVQLESKQQNDRLRTLSVSAQCLCRELRAFVRNLDRQIAELETRVAFPEHWSDGEHQLNLVKLQQLLFEKVKVNRSKGRVESP